MMFGFMRAAMEAAVGGPVWGVTATAGRTVTITSARSNLQTAPEAFTFDVTTTGFTSNIAAGVDGSYDDGFHDLLIFWDYGEGYDFTAPTQVLAMDVVDGGDRKDARYSIGPLAAMVYRADGNKVVRCAVYEPSSDSWGQGIYYIGGGTPDTPTIAAATATYPTFQTIFVDTGSIYTGAPTGAILRNDINAAMDEMMSLTVAARIILRRGQTHTVTGGRNLARYGTKPALVSWRIEASDPADGARPILDLDDAGFTPGGTLFNDALRAGSASVTDQDAIFQNLDLRGLWDSTTETGDAVTFYGAFDQSGQYVLFDGCVASGWRILSNTGTSNEKHATYNDCDVSDWQLYGLTYDSSQESVINVLGCQVAQHVDALAGGPTSPANTRNNQGSARVAASSRVYVHQSDMFCNTGGTPRGALFDPQPCLRILQNMTSGGKKGYICGGVYEGGVTTITAGNSEEGNVDVNVNLRISGPLVIGGWQTGTGIGINYSGVTIEGGVTVFPSVYRDGTALGGSTGYAPAFLRASRSNATGLASAYSDPVRYTNWTMINLCTDADITNGGSASPIVDTGVGSITVVQSNNVVHQPNIGTPQTTFAPLTRVQMVTPRYSGYKDATVTPAAGLSKATPAIAGSVYVPASGSSAIDAATTGHIYRLGFVPNYTTDAIISSRDQGAMEA